MRWFRRWYGANPLHLLAMFGCVTLTGYAAGGLLQVNGTDLSPDHGYPARVIVPDNPGVHNTKWVASLTFRP